MFRVIAVLAALVLASTIEARGPRTTYSMSSVRSVSTTCANGSCAIPQSMVVPQGTVVPQSVVVPQQEAVINNPAITTTTVTTTYNALYEVNAARVRRGLRPFVEDPHLTAGAYRVAEYRASRGMAGHTHNDFAIGGVSASAGGCGALEPSWGWGTCCTYDNHTYAGAATVMGRDGKRYMQIFVR